MTTFPELSHLLIAAVGAIIIAAAARAVRALALSGAIAAAIIGFCLYGFGGWRGAVALLLFFVTSSALSRIGKRRKAALAFEKGGERDAGQAFANGGVATLAAVLLPFTGAAPWNVAALLGALAAANADTWATELGALAKGEPRMITTFRPAPTGSSGAISVPGTLAALAGAALVAATAFLWPGGLRLAIAATVGGFVGSLIDSLIGATIQEQRKCPVCGKLTESATHCDTPTEYAKGIRGFNNDTVNAVATLSGALCAALLAL